MDNLTGDEDVVKMLTAMLRNEFIGVRPTMFYRNQNIQEHIGKVEEFLTSLNIKDDKKMSRILLSTLSEDVRAELLCQYDFENKWEYMVPKLKQLFKEKQTKVSPLIKLLNVRQKANQTLRDYVSELRVEAYRIMKELSIQEREQYLITAFLNGICDSRTSTAIKSLKPLTLEEAFNMVKKEQKYSPNSDLDFDVAVRNIKYETENDSLRQAVAKLTSEVNDCKNMIRKLLKANNVPQTRKSNSTIKCFNCQENHLLKDCRKPKKCDICHKTNHITRFHKDFGKIRHLKEYDSLSEATKESSENISELDENDQGDFFTVRNIQNDDTEMMTECQINNPKRDCDEFRTVTHRKKRNKKVKEDDKEVNEIIQYIENNGPKPETYCETLISKSNPEKAKNKPIIRGELEGYRGKFFLDSGAETNVIDSKLFHKLRSVNPGITFIEKSSYMRCANNSRLKCLGVTFLKTNFGSHSFSLRFLVVDNIFPRIFVGIKSMKDMKIDVKPGNNCAQIGKEIFPFVSKIDSEITQSSSEN